MITRLMVVFVVMNVLAMSAFAESPHVSYIFPAGGQRGAEVSYKVGGHYLHEGCPFEMTGPGVSASARIERTKTVWFEGPLIPQPASQRKEDYPNDYLGSVKIAKGAPLGFRRWRVNTSQGVTSRMKFVVGDLPEVTEEEIDGEPIPTSVQLPVTINGRIFPREDVDIWTFDAEAGKRISCEVNAARIGSPLDSRIEIRGPDGSVLTENVDALGVDSFVQFVAPMAGRYECRIHDIEFGGLQHYVYRLTIRKGPYLKSVYPLGGQRGDSVTIQLSGTDLPMNQANIAIPKNSARQFNLSLPNVASNNVTLVAGNLPEHLEVEPNDATDSVKPEAVSLKSGMVFNGRIDKPGDIDLFRFSAEVGKTLLLEVQSSRLGTELDSVLSVLSSDGKQLKLNDDLAGGIPDSRIVWKVPSGESFFAQIRDQFDHLGGSRFAYRISISEVSEQHFELKLPLDTVNIEQGAETKLKIGIDRSFGFKGEVELSAEELPDGVTVEPVRITTNRQDAQLVIKVDESAMPQIARLKVVGKTVDIEPESKREATFAATAGHHPVPGLTLGVAIKTPFRIYSPFETRYASRGTTYTRHYNIDRGDFEGPIEIEADDRQVRHLQGVTGQKVIVPPGESEFDYTVSLPPWMEIGRTSRFCLMGSAFVTDGSGTRHRVSFSSHAQDDQVIVLVDPVRISLQLPTSTFVVKRGGSIRIPVKIQRGTGLAGAVRIHVSSPPHLKGWSVEPIVVAADEDFGMLSLRVDQKSSHTFNSPLVVNAVLKDANGKPNRTESRISIRLQDAQSVSQISVDRN
ncbi:MAG: PPC domain-containing protein [Planctomycetaceae bacterium]|nr:PPC domain-containing protein [Planctomycetaceae bacterium]